MYFLIAGLEEPFLSFKAMIASAMRFINKYLTPRYNFKKFYLL
jgi:hypothetical protein